MGFNLTGTTIYSFYFAKPSGWNTGFKRWNFSFLPSEDKTGFRSLSKETFPISNDSRSTRREIDSKLLACRLSEKITHERLLFFLEKQSHSMPNRSPSNSFRNPFKKSINSLQGRARYNRDSSSIASRKIPRRTWLSSSSSSFSIRIRFSEFLM